MYFHYIPLRFTPDRGLVRMNLTLLAWSARRSATAKLVINLEILNMLCSKTYFRVLKYRHRGSASLGGVVVGYGLTPSGILGLLRISRRAASSCGVLRVIQSNQPPESSSSDSDFSGSGGSGFQSSCGVKLRNGNPSASLVKASDLSNQTLSSRNRK